MPRVRFAPSPTGYLHIGSARTFIFNWLYARRNQGTMILRIDDTDVERNTEASLNSIFEGLKWLGLNWDEFYRQSDRLDLHQKLAWQIFANGHAYRDFTPAHQGEEDRAGGTVGPWLFNSAARELSAEESQRRADAGEPFVLRFLVPRHEARYIKFPDAVYATQSKSVNDIEDFALLRSNGIPTYHLASCADDIDLRIFFKNWHFGFAVTGQSPRGALRSFQFFDIDGTAIHKVFLTDASNLSAYEKLVGKYCSADQSPKVKISSKAAKKTERNPQRGQHRLYL